MLYRGRKVRFTASCVGAAEFTPTSIVVTCKSQQRRKVGGKKKKHSVLTFCVGGNKHLEEKVHRSKASVCFMWLLAISAPG